MLVELSHQRMKEEQNSAIKRLQSKYTPPIQLKTVSTNLKDVLTQ